MSAKNENIYSTTNVSFQNSTTDKSLKLSECDLKNRQLIEQALTDPHARIPAPFQQYFYDYVYTHSHQNLRQINYLAQIAFLLYFFADILIIPDMFFMSGLIRVVLVLGALFCCYYLFKKYKNIQVLDRIVPIGTTVAAAAWIGLLVLSSSPHVATYIYASAIFILVANLCIQTQFKVAVYCSILIALFIMLGANQLMSTSQAFIFAVVFSPLWFFSIYINWNNILNVRRSFLRSLLDEWNYQTLKNLAHTDDLTQLYNRRHFVDMAERSIHQWPKHASSCLLMFDVDHFKNINDSYGHDVGDRVLQLIAEVTRKEMRYSDVLARFGGEEFIALLEDTQLQDSLVIAERIRCAIQKQYIYVKPNHAIRFTISIGIAELESHTQTLEDLIKQADIALYQAKKTGRNRIEVYHPDILDQAKPATDNPWNVFKSSTQPVQSATN
ncbi:GGDEF domain-containing protein [Acinetobacter pecorum]|uniref:diguanylate cyclase n=1 Tax=Acinetobacter pecorum TaxID=2762215 RepID=A0ABR8VWY9_9GAMM|nr:GGDEF domain-containing protein [Acinetobacter pecorum]MBD8009280.1 GGDEF domain-containing protein [Acinetobacter pecorum]